MTLEIKAIIVDDEFSSREILHRLLTIEGSVSVIAKCQNIDEALIATAQLKPDLVFLDIEMPGGNGFQYIERLKPLGSSPEIVFVTAYNQYAIQAIKSAAFDYLLKPVDIDDLTSCLKRYKESIVKENFTDKTDILLKHLNDIGKVRFYSKGGIIFVDPQDIIWCQASGSYTIIHFKGGKNDLVSIPLKEVEELLHDYHFFRASRSALINLHYIVKLDKKSRNCIVRCEEKIIEIPVSPQQLKVFD